MTSGEPTATHDGQPSAENEGSELASAQDQVPAEIAAPPQEPTPWTIMQDEPSAAKDAQVHPPLPEVDDNTDSAPLATLHANDVTAPEGTPAAAAPETTAAAAAAPDSSSDHSILSPQPIAMDATKALQEPGEESVPVVPSEVAESTDSTSAPSGTLPSNVDLQKLLATLSPAPQASSEADPSHLPADPNQPPQTVVEPTSLEFSPQEEAAYERFVEDEREYVTRGQWDRFPIGSRIFIGNLPSEKVDKRDVFKLFAKHGRLAQISIKQAYGFVQYYTAEDAAKAIEMEQNAPLAGRSMHLEVSKPQKPRNQNRRSRSPDRRGSPPRRREARGHGGSRDDFDSKRRRDDDYGRRSPRYRDEYRSGGPGRLRSPSPPRGRPPQAVPDVQLIITEDVDRGYVYYVENSFLNKRIRVDVLYLTPRMSIPEVVKHMIVEGVLAVVFLNRNLQSTNKVSMQVFDRRGGASNVRFDEYQNIEIAVAVELANRARANATPVYPQAPTIVPSMGGVATGNQSIANLLGSLDPASLQQVLGSLQQGGSAPGHGIGAGYGQSTPQAYGGVPNNAALQQLLGAAGVGGGGATGVQPAATPQQQQNVQNIMQQLSRLQGQQR